MEKLKNDNGGLIAIEKPSFISRIKSKLSNKNKLPKSKKNDSFLEKNNVYIIIAIATISAFITVKVSFNSITASPVPSITKDTAISIISNLDGTVWNCEQGKSTLPEELENVLYNKIEFTKKNMADGLTIPVKFFKGNSNSLLGVELGYVSYNIEKQNLIVVLPNSNSLMFMYTESSNSDLENITLVGKGNKRYYFTKEEYKESN